jgi:hypothetical protein
MNWKKHASTIVLVLCAIPLAIYAFLDRKSISDAERKDRQADVFPAYRRQDVSRVELTISRTKLVVERRQGPGDAGDTEWWMTSPRDERADAAAVDKLLGDIEFAGIVRKVDPGIATFDAPRVTGVMSMGSVVYRFALGGDAPTPQGAAYFRVDGEGTFVVSKDFALSLTKAPDAYRERTVVPYLSLDLQRLEVKGGGAQFTLERMDDVSFRLPELGLRASRETLDRVWGALAEGRAESFLSDADADAALGPDPVTIAMKARDASRKDGVLAVGGPCPGHPEDIVIARRTPTRLSACVPKGMLPGLLLTSAELVDTRLFAARGDEVAELVLESVPPRKRVEIARKGTSWHERAPTDRELSPEEADAANALALALTKGEGTDPAAHDPKDPFPAVARVRIERGEGKGEEVVELGPASNGVATVRRNADGATLHVSEALAHHLVPSEIVFRGKQVFPRSLEGKLATGLEATCDGNSQVLSRVGGVWVFDKPSGLPADAAIMGDVVNFVTRAQADSWVADADDGTFGFAQGGCSLVVTFDEDGGPHKVGILFGREAEGGGFFAHALGEEPIFLAAKSLHDDAGRLLVDRARFHVGAAEVDMLTLARDGKRLVLTVQVGKSASGGGSATPRLVFADGGAADPDDKLVVALDGMRADAVIHLGAPVAAEGFARPSLDVRIKARADSGAKDVHFVVGESALVMKERMFYARVDGVDATYAIARDRLAPLLDAL